jgi:hypothetical protein
VNHPQDKAMAQTNKESSMTTDNIQRQVDKFIADAGVTLPGPLPAPSPGLEEILLEAIAALGDDLTQEQAWEWCWTHRRDVLEAHGDELAQAGFQQRVNERLNELPEFSERSEESGGTK